MNKNSNLKHKALVHIKNNRYKEALLLLKKITKKNKLDLDSLYVLSTIYSKLGMWDNTAKCLIQIIKINPSYKNVRLNLAIAHIKNKDMTRAIMQLKKIQDNTPNDSSTLASLARLFLRAGDIKEANSIYNVLLTRPELDTNIIIDIADISYVMGHITKASLLYEQAISQQPHNAQLYDKLGIAYCNMGEIDKALKAHNEAIRLDANDKKSFSNYLLTMHYSINIDQQFMFDKHKEYASKFFSTNKCTHDISHQHDQTVKIGFVSADLRTHSVAYFAEAILKECPVEYFEIHIFSDCQRNDETTERISKYNNHWYEVVTLDDIGLYNLITQNKIDILIDLAGHSSKNRLGIFAKRAAPLQMTYLGYPDTTAIPNIDFRIVDNITDPENEDTYCTEHLLRIPDCFLCYTPSKSAPEICELPAVNNNYITFGSFNNLSKINDSVINCWAQLLKHINNSKILIKNPSFTDEEVRQKIKEKFVLHGIEAGRLILRGRTDSVEDHLRLYNEIDIALDTFPYNGTTTTCEALWMGVPVITLKGKSHMSRVGSSLLTAINMSHLIAESETEYINIAQQVSSDLQLLENTRTNMRQRLSVSKLLDQQSFSKNYYSLIREIWQKYSNTSRAQ